MAGPAPTEVQLFACTNCNSVTAAAVTKTPEECAACDAESFTKIVPVEVGHYD